MSWINLVPGGSIDQVRTRSQSPYQSRGEIAFGGGGHAADTFSESLVLTTRTISRTFSISINSSTSSVIPKTCSKSLARDKWPTESQPGMSLALVSRDTDCGSISNAVLNASRTVAKTSAVCFI